MKKSEKKLKSFFLPNIDKNKAKKNFLRRLLAHFYIVKDIFNEKLTIIEVAF